MLKATGARMLKSVTIFEKQGKLLQGRLRTVVMEYGWNGRRVDVGVHQAFLNRHTLLNELLGQASRSKAGLGF